MNGYVESWKPRLALVVMAIFAGCTGAALAWGDTGTKSSMLGAATVMATTAVNYFFGSSSGAQKKDETIAAQGVMLAQSHPPTPPAPAPGAGMQSPDPEVEALRHQVQ